MAKQKDVGHVAFVIVADPEQELVVFQFGTPVSRLTFSPEAAMEIAGNIISRAAIASGKTVEAMVMERTKKNESQRA